MQSATDSLDHPLSESAGSERRAERFAAIRRTTEALCRPLSAEDAMLSATPDTSPPKWHLAHTTWFFDRFFLRADSDESHPYDFLFNSYYETLGSFLPKVERPLLSRPSLAEVFAYRADVDRRVAARLRAGIAEGAAAVLELGLQHEQQHQELLLMDILRNFSAHPHRPAYLPAPSPTPPRAAAGSPRARAEPEWLRFDGGRVAVGASADEDGGFAYDNERGRHTVELRPFEIAASAVTNGEYLAFVRDGGYARPTLWLSDGWAARKKDDWRAPLYWEGRDQRESSDREDADVRPRAMSLHGVEALDLEAPVAHVSYYEAQAYAAWKGARLPTEFEWEHAAARTPARGAFLEDARESGRFAPRGGGFHGNLWEWTQSAYLPYPGYRPPAGALGEYNGKFMCGPFVLRGGSYATPRNHYRPTYRNFYHPHHRWAFSGFRLARDAGERERSHP